MAMLSQDLTAEHGDTDHSWTPPWWIRREEGEEYSCQRCLQANAGDPNIIECVGTYCIYALYVQMCVTYTYVCE